VKRAFFYPDNDTVETIELHSTAIIILWCAMYCAHLQYDVSRCCAS